jgi:hypothetical protein
LIAKINSGKLITWATPGASRGKEPKVSLFLSGLPLWAATILLVVLPTMAAMCGPILVRRRIGLECLATNNQIAGFKFATVGVIYAVLLAFAVIVVWEKFTDAETAVVQEAGAAATLYPLASGLEPGSGRDTGRLDQLPSAFDRSGMAADGGRKRKPRGDAGAQRALCRRPAPDG